MVFFQDLDFLALTRLRGHLWGPMGPYGPNVATELEAEGRLMGPFWPRAEGGRWFLLRPDGFYCDRVVFISTGWFLFVFFQKMKPGPDFWAQGLGPGPRDGRAQGLGLGCW